MPKNLPPKETPWNPHEILHLIQLESSFIPLGGVAPRFRNEFHRGVGGFHKGKTMGGEISKGNLGEPFGNWYLLAVVPPKKNDTSVDPKQLEKSRAQGTLHAAYHILVAVVLVVVVVVVVVVVGGNRKQRETTRLESPGRLPHQPTPTPTHKGRQPETTGDKTT